jgi:carbamoylphosphate synthase small subunit
MRLKDEPLTVVAIDFGMKRNILRRLASYGCRVIVVPADTPPEKLSNTTLTEFFSPMVQATQPLLVKELPRQEPY